MQVHLETQFAGYRCVQIENESLSLRVTTSVGPRILSLALNGGKNLFAELPELTLDCPWVGAYHLHGGHRLWHAPEDPQRTYIPDDDPLTVSEMAGGIQVTQPVEPQTGIQKSLAITLPNQRAQVLVDHRLQNLGCWPIELAPWAITQLKPGGVAILPQASTPVDQHGVLPNRQIALWPYTQMNSPHITWGNRYIFISATMQDGSLKLGYPNPMGWLGYILGNTLFVKRAAYESGAEYFDHGSSSECYCNPFFLELETLGPRKILAPGETLSHQETWALYGQVEFTTSEDAMQALVESLEL